MCLAEWNRATGRAPRWLRGTRHAAAARARAALRGRARHEAVARIRARAARGEIFRLDRGDLVGGDAVLRDLGAQIVEARRVVDANGRDAGLHGLFVEGVHELVVVEPPVRAQLGGEQRVADGVTLPAVRLERRDRAVHFLHPPLLLGREYGVAQETPGAGDFV